MLIVYVAVLGRNRTLFHCILQSHFHYQSAIDENFHSGQGSYAQQIHNYLTSVHSTYEPGP